MSSSSVSDHQHTSQSRVSQARGYVEGYYGKLLSWSERCDLVSCLSSLQLNTYCYAPKEDVNHRLNWRALHSAEWQQSFQQFCSFANANGVSVVAGIAPGLDFQFGTNDHSSHHVSDFNHLYSKAEKLVAAGANEILVLWDDIDDDIFSSKNGLSEGAGHASVVNELASALGQPIWTVPRVYAAEIENKNNYLEDFFAELHTQHTVLLCGNAIVPGSVSTNDLAGLSRSEAGVSVHRTILWDNFYANDYCPRRLFLGPWTGRENIGEYLINPTGMPETDQLLLDIVSTTQHSHDRRNWLEVFKKHGVPDAFEALADFFYKPVFGDEPISQDHINIQSGESTKFSAEDVAQAIEKCLWKWKSPLAREWYPFIMGLKHDLALAQGTLPTDRVLKTQPAGLAMRLLK